MVFKIINRKDIDEMCSWLEFYDLNGYFPWERKKVLLSISGEAIEILNIRKNKSNFVNKLILNN